MQGKDIAAVIIEPLPANYGLLVQRPEFLKRVAELCEKNGSLLIFDEVISGFRVGLAGMVEKPAFVLILSPMEKSSAEDSLLDVTVEKPN